MSTETDDESVETPQTDTVFQTDIDSQPEPVPQMDSVLQADPDPQPESVSQIDCTPQIDLSSHVVSARSGRIINKLSLILLAVLALVALIEFFYLGLARRTFVFYTDTEAVIVEERMLRVTGENPMASGKKPTETLSREINITRYVEEALLGPVLPDSLPLFPKGTRLLSLLYRDGIVYTDLSQDAAMPLPGGDVFRNLETLYSGIKRNFPYVRGIRFFIAGKAAYAAQFDQAGEIPANSEI
jgi:hypothetical protein